MPRNGREVPRIDVERVREDLLHVRRQRAAARIDDAHALRAVRRIDLLEQELSARLQIVPALGVVGKGEVVLACCTGFAPGSAGAALLPPMVKPVSVMRGDPVVIGPNGPPLDIQWFDQCVRFDSPNR